MPEAAPIDWSLDRLQVVELHETHCLCLTSNADGTLPYLTLSCPPD